jgi:hypothetical protein
MPKIRPLGLTAICLSGLLFNSSVFAQTPSKTTLSPFSDQSLRGLLESCRSGKPSFNLTAPSTQTNTTSIRAIAKERLTQTDKTVKAAEANISRQVDQANQQVETQVQQRKIELANLMRDPKEFNEQIKQMKAAIAAKATPEAQRKQLSQLLKDLQAIQRNPATLNAKAEESRLVLLKRIRLEGEKAQAQVRQQAKEQRNRLTSCTCKIETLQRQYSTPASSQQSSAESADPKAKKTVQPLTQKWADIGKTCKQ